MIRPFGLGPAIFIAIITIICFILIGIAAGRLKGLTGVLCIAILTSIVFAIIAFWPTYQPNEPNHKGPIDYIFLPRIGLLVFLIIVLLKILSEVISHGLLSVKRVQHIGKRSTKSKITIIH